MMKRPMSEMIKRILSLGIAAVICMALVLPAAAYPAHTNYIGDEATVLDEQTENAIIELSRVLEEQKNVKIAVCTVLTTGDESVDKYASGIFKEWDVKHGVLILLVIEDDTFYAVQSNSVADVLTSEKLSDIVNSTMEPRFAEKDYAAGALAAAGAISVFISENIQDKVGEDKGGMPTWLSVILTIILIISIILIGGYVLLVYLERRQALRRRAELEERRRRAAQGRGGSYPAGRGGAGSDPRRRAPSAQSGRANGGNPGVRREMERTGQFNPAVQRRPQRQNPYEDSAATVQISTADIRAARNNRR